MPKPASPSIIRIEDLTREALGALREPVESRPAVRTNGSADLENSTGRQISYVLSDTSVGRDNHVVAASAWQLDNFLRNPVMPWAHDTSQPTIAKWVDIATRGNRLVGTAEYADRDTYPFADTIFRLVKGGFLNAVSTSWLPIEWKFSTDRSRPGGIDFLKVDLLECSQVPVPALPTAIATARAAGIDTGPVMQWAERLLDCNNFAVLPREELETLRREAKMPTPAKPARAPAHKTTEWKVGLSRTLPIDRGAAWDAAAAEEAIFELCGFGTDSPNVTLARKAFLFFDASRPNERSSYNLPIATVIDGRLIAVADGIRDALEQRGAVPADVLTGAGAALDVYAGKIQRKLTHKRSLYQVSWLAYLLEDLGYLHSSAEYEAAIEEDNSPIPGHLFAALKELGQVLVAMTAEEVAELLAGKEVDELDDVIEMASDAGIKRHAFNLLRRLDVGAIAGLSGAMREHLKGRTVTFTTGDQVTPVARAGRVLSAENERCLREAHDHVTKAADIVRGVVDQCDDDNDDDNQNDDNERALRVRRATALRLKVATSA